MLQVFGGGAREVALVEWELAQAAHLDGSNAFAGIVDQKLRTSAGMPSVALQRAPMRNLAGTNMPAVLIEMGYLSNPEEEQLLRSNEFQNGIALALTEAVSAFRDHVEQEPQVSPVAMKKKMPRGFGLYVALATVLVAGLIAVARSRSTLARDGAAKKRAPG